jgi:hypothetical protein
VRVVIVPGTLALLPEYASIEDPIPELRKVVDEAVAWLLEDGVAAVLAASPSARRIADHLLRPSPDVEPVETRTPNLLVVANGSATRTEKAPGHLDERAAAFDAAIGASLRAGEPAALADIDLDLADELWALPDADVLRTLADRVPPVDQAHVDYDDDPFGVQYWVVRWQCPEE